MRVLVAYASRMGSTREIAEALEARLGAAGLEVDLRTCADQPDPAGYTAAVVGSAIYVRRWAPEARAFLRQQGARLPTGRTWFFQSGPCGPGAEVEQVTPPRMVTRLTARLGAPGVMTFGGRLEGDQAIGPISRWLATGTELAGDFRDFSRIEAWADDIAAQLTAP